MAGSSTALGRYSLSTSCEGKPGTRVSSAGLVGPTPDPLQAGRIRPLPTPASSVSGSQPRGVSVAPQQTRHGTPEWMPSLLSLISPPWRGRGGRCIRGASGPSPASAGSCIAFANTPQARLNCLTKARAKLAPKTAASSAPTKPASTSSGAKPNSKPPANEPAIPITRLNPRPQPLFRCHRQASPPAPRSMSKNAANRPNTRGATFMGYLETKGLRRIEPDAPAQPLALGLSPDISDHARRGA
jgi:hypothetical protein